MLRLEAAPFIGIYNAPEESSRESEIYKKIVKIKNVIGRFHGCTSGNRHPSPFDDTLLYSTLEDYCLHINQVRYGFIDIKQLRAWFPDDDLLIEFHKLGVTVAEYFTNPRYDGNAQCAAKIKPEDLVKRTSILEFFNLV